MRITGPNKRQKASEGDLIRQIGRYFRVAASRSSGLRLTIGDDAAVWKPRPGFETVLTCDWFLERTHFLRNLHPPNSVGWKCLARAVSDVAAMGGEPRCFLLSFALPETCTGKWLDGFLRGLRRASTKLNCSLAGGDTTRRDDILINISVVGEVARGAAALRSSARAGDRIFVSGRLGEAELGWKFAKRSPGLVDERHELLKKHLFPEPRLELGRWLVQNKICTAMMDLSDGLSSDLARLCEASGVGAAIGRKDLPLSSRKFSSEYNEKDRLAAALHGGDDYELLFCVGKDKAKKIPPRLFGVSLTEIGEITVKRHVRLVEPSGKSERLLPRGWDPFRN